MSTSYLGLVIVDGVCAGVLFNLDAPVSLHGLCLSQPEQRWKNSRRLPSSKMAALLVHEAGADG